MEGKNFIGREHLVITDEIRVLISASAVQLTFGLRDYTISHLHTINVFPHVFYSKFYHTSFKGLNTQNGILSLSWNDFKEGYATEHDKINLGLHELAHALNIDLVEDGNFDEHFSSYFGKWSDVALNDYNNLKEGKVNFLRSYGGTNMHEFFAVCVEHFFAVPTEFKNQLPRLYNFLVLMLNQDPENAANDYKVEKVAEKEQYIMAEPASTRDALLTNIIVRNSSIDEQLEGSRRLPAIRKFIKQRGIYIAMTATFAGLFGGIPLLIWFWSSTVISIGGVLVMLFICGSLGLIQWKYVKEHLDMEYHQFSMYAFSGFGMCLLNLIFCLNYMIHINSYSRTYDVLSLGNSSQGIEIVLSGEGHDSSFERNVAAFISDHGMTPIAKKITVSVQTGLFGLDMINGCKLN